MSAVEGLLAGVYGLMERFSAVAPVGCFLWGAVSALLSPCHLAAIPMLAGYAAGQGEATFWRGVRCAVAFCLGLAMSVAALGAACALLGRMLGSIPKWGEAAAGVLLLAMAFSLWRRGTCCPAVGFSRGASGALLLGLVWGVVSGACTFAFLAPVLAVIFVQKRVVAGVVMACCFAAGYGAPLVLCVAGAGEWARRRPGGANAANKAACVCLCLAGGYFIVSALF